MRDSVRFGRVWALEPKTETRPQERFDSIRFDSGSGSGFGSWSVISIITELCSPLETYTGGWPHFLVSKNHLLLTRELYADKEAYDVC